MEGFNLEKWNELYDKGLEGYYYESIGEIEKSILVFEYVIENGSNIPLHFDRLRIIYNRQKKYDDCYRICKKYLEIFDKKMERNKDDINPFDEYPSYKHFYDWKIKMEKKINII
jgi:hypothetical protein